MADPLFPPAQETLAEAVMAAVAGVVLPTVTCAVVVQPSASVTVTEYAPPASPVALLPLPPEGDQE